MARLIDAALQDFMPELRDPPCWRSMRVADVSPSAWKDPRFVQVWGLLRVGDSARQGKGPWRLGVSKPSDTVRPKRTTPSDTSSWRNSGPGGERSNNAS